MINKLINWFRSYKPTDSFGYFNDQGDVLMGVIHEGEVLLNVKIAANLPKGTYPLRKPQDVTITISPAGLAALKQWFGNLDLSNGVTYVSSKYVPLSSTPPGTDGTSL